MLQRNRRSRHGGASRWKLRTASWGWFGPGAGWFGPPSMLERHGAIPAEWLCLRRPLGRAARVGCDGLRPSFAPLGWNAASPRAKAPRSGSCDTRRSGSSNSARRARRASRNALRASSCVGMWPKSPKHPLPPQFLPLKTSNLHQNIHYIGLSWLSVSYSSMASNITTYLILLCLVGAAAGKAIAPAPVFTSREPTWKTKGQQRPRNDASTLPLLSIRLGPELGQGCNGEIRRCAPKTGTWLVNRSPTAATHSNLRNEWGIWRLPSMRSRPMRCVGDRVGVDGQRPWAENNRGSAVGIPKPRLASKGRTRTWGTRLAVLQARRASLSSVSSS